MTVPAPPFTPTPVSPRLTESSNDVGMIGDGSTVGSRSRSRWRRVRWPIIVLGTLVLLGVVVVFARPPASHTDRRFDPNSPEPQGSKAIIQVLSRQGVHITQATSVTDAMRAAKAGTTLAVLDDGTMSAADRDALLKSPADLVLVEPGGDLINGATDGKVAVEQPWITVSEVRTANCDDVDAQAAGSITTRESGFIVDSGVTACFPEPGYAEYNSFVTLRSDDRTVTAIADGTLMTNGSVAHEGNAALGLRALGKHEELVWLYRFDADPQATAENRSGGVMPEQTPTVLLFLVALTVVIALWQGRRLGRLVSEELPVVVRASEATIGRGRLYRRTQARGHAAAGLRAASADRMATRLGLPRSAGPNQLVDACVRATGRTTQDITESLYGPPPADDGALLELARHLDRIESEVYHQ